MGFLNEIFSSEEKQKDSLVLECFEKKILPFLEQENPESLESLESLVAKYPKDLSHFLQRQILSWNLSTIIKITRLFLQLKNQKKLENFLENLEPQDKKDRLWVFLITFILSPCKERMFQCIQKKIYKILGEKTAQALNELISGKEPENPSYITLLKGSLGLPLLPVLKKLTQNPNIDIAQSALLTLACIGEEDEEILSILMQSLSSQDAAVCKGAAIALSMLGEKSVPCLKQALASPIAKLRISAAWSFGKMEKEAKGATLELLNALEDEDIRVRNAAQWALEKIGGEIASFLAAKMKSTQNIFMLDSGCELITKLSLDFPETREILMNLASHPEKKLRKKAIQGLGANRVMDSSSILIKALEDTEEIQIEALKALEKFVSFVPDAIEPVIVFFKKDNPGLRKAAANALFQIGGKEEKTKEAFLYLLSDKEVSLKRSALRGLALFQEKAQVALPQILQILESTKEKSLILHCMETISQIGEQAKEAIPLLEKWVLSEEDSLFTKAAKALGSIGIEGAIPLLNLIEKANAKQRKEITKALAKIGTPVIPYLVKAIKSDSSLLREVASDTLGNLGQDSLHILRLLMKETDFWVKKAVMRAWQKNGKVAIPFLIEMIRDQDDFNASVMALEILKKMKHIALSNIILLLDDPQPQLSQLAVQSLRRVNQEYQQAIPDLLPLLKDSKPLIRQSVAWCLGEIGHKEPVVLEALESLEKDSDIMVIKIAKEAKEKLGRTSGKSSMNAD